MSRDARRRRAVLVLPLLLALGACGSGPAPSPAPGTTTAPAVPRGEWTTVATLSGVGGTAQDTAPFSVHGGQVRFVYSVKWYDSEPPVLWTMYRKGEPANPANAVAHNSCSPCDREKTDDLGQVPAGDYYLQMTALHIWVGWVEERR